MKKREYLSLMADRISCEADGEALWDAYKGSTALEAAYMAYFERRAEVWGVDAPTAGVYILNCKPGADGMARAVEATGFRREGRVVRLVV